VHCSFYFRFFSEGFSEDIKFLELFNYEWIDRSPSS